MLLPGPISRRIPTLVLIAASFGTGYLMDAQTPPPAIQSLSVLTGAPGDSVTITGIYFGAKPGSVRFGFVTVNVAPGSWSDTKITVPVPIMPAGPANIVVPVGGTDSNPQDFTVACAAGKPCIESVIPPTALPGDPVTIKGKNFGTRDTVTFGGTAADIRSWSDKSIDVTVPNITAGIASIVVKGGDHSPSAIFTVVTAISITVSPRVIQPASGKLPASVNLGVFEANCDDRIGVDLAHNGSAPYSIKIMGGGLTPSSQPTPGKCAITSVLTIDPSVTSGTYDVVLLNKDGTSVGKAEIAVLDSSAGPIPPGLPPQVDVMWEVMSQNNCSDVFGKRISQTEYCIQVKIGNNSGYPLQIAGIGFSKKIGSLPGQPEVTTANSSYASTRSVLIWQNVTNGRNILYNTIQAAGVVMAGFTPYFGTGLHPNGTVNNARTNWTTAASIVSGPILSAFNIIAPNPIITQLNNLDDQSFRDTKVIANNSQVQTVVFVEKKALTNQLRDLGIQFKSSPLMTNNPDKGNQEVKNDFKDTVSNSANPDLIGWAIPLVPYPIHTKKDFDPLFVKLALGNMVIVGDQIAYINRVQIQSNAAPSTPSGPLSVSPSNLTFTRQDILTTSATQTVTLTNTSSSSLTGITSTVIGPNKDDFKIRPGQPNDCSPPSSTLGASPATCTISVTFAPSPTMAVERTATLQIAYSQDATAEPPQTVTLSGTANVPPDNVPVNPATGDVKTVAKGQTGTATLTIGNAGNTDLTNVRFTIPATSAFKSSDNCNNVLAAGNTCTVTVTFTAAANAPSKTYSDSLTMNYHINGGDASKVIALSAAVP